MSLPTLTKIQTTLLTAAATHPDGLVLLPERMSEAAGARHLATFEGLKLILVREAAGDTTPHLTPAGYRAVGLRPPRKPKAPGEAAVRGSKRDLVGEMLGREGGATVPELMAATGWLAHTTRAALSRIRSGGQALAKSTREDGTTAYRIVAEQPAAERRVRQPEPDSATLSAVL